MNKLNDQQIYEALVEHARKQHINLPSILAKYPESSTNIFCTNSNQQVLKNKLESIDTYLEEEDDLPIIIRNLHSVKSLKHFFEIRTKSILNKNIDTSGSNQQGSKNNDSIGLASCALAKSENQLKQKSVNALQSITAQNIEMEKIVQARQFEKPVAPPLPEFLKKLTNLQTQHQEELPLKILNLTEQDLAQSISDLKPHDSNPILTMHQKYYTKLGKPDLHHRLIREIHDKSLERSKKDSNIRFDERGNLIGSTFLRDNANRVSCGEQRAKFKLKNHFSHLEEESNDNLNELISISQIPSVIQTLERRDSCRELARYFPSRVDIYT